MASPIVLTQVKMHSSILIKCLPPYIIKWISLLMSVSLLQYIYTYFIVTSPKGLFNRHNRLALACPASLNSIVFHLRLLTYSLCPCDVQQYWARASGRLCKLTKDTTVIRTSEVEKKLRSQQISLYIANLIEGESACVNHFHILCP